MYFACLRVGEVVTLNRTQHTIQYANTQIIEGKLLIHLKSYKYSNQETRKIIFNPTLDKLCPVKAYRSYIKMRGRYSGPLFITRHSQGILREQISRTLKKNLKYCKFNTAKYSTHYFRRGRITDLAIAGTAYSKMQTIGRFKSTAYLKCIKPTLINTS